MDVKFLETILMLLVGSPGIGVIISMLVGLFKTLGFVKDGMSKIWVQLMTLAVFVAMTVLTVLGIDFDMASINDWLEASTKLAMMIMSLIGSDIAYGQLRGTPIVGKSFADEKRKTKTG